MKCPPALEKTLQYTYSQKGRVVSRLPIAA